MIRHTLVLLGLLLGANSASAELFVYTDADGVMHFSNVQPGSEKKVGENSYAVEEANRTKRLLHRVNISKYDSIIKEAAKYYSLPPELVKAVIAAESNFEARAYSSAGAIGLMQMIPSTAKEMHVQDPYDPKQNIYGGTRYLRILANRFEGNIDYTLAGYNAGPHRVEQYDGIPPFKETKIYVARVKRFYEHYLAKKDL